MILALNQCVWRRWMHLLNWVLTSDVMKSGVTPTAALATVGGAGAQFATFVRRTIAPPPHRRAQA
jgi:hypothetical protein